jgi:DNA-binding transcriptional LysR family regulator
MPVSPSVEANEPKQASLISFSPVSDTLNLSPLFDLRRLRYFVTVAEDLHFGRAALRLQIAQPALSQQIRKLERELGVELFARERGKKATLTEPGAVLLEEGRRVLARAGDAALATQRAARGEMGVLRVGFSPSSAISVLPLSVRLFRERRPNVHLELEELLSDEIAAQLRSGDRDIGIVRSPVDRSGLELEIVAKEKLFVALPVGHPLAGRRRITIRSLAYEPLVTSSPVGASGWHRDVYALYRRRGLTPSIAQEVSTIQAQLGLVAAGIGIALVPSSVEQLHLAGIITIPVDAPMLRMLVARRDGNPTAAQEQFVQCVREAGAAWGGAAAETEPERETRTAIAVD